FIFARVLNTGNPHTRGKFSRIARYLRCNIIGTSSGAFPSAENGRGGAESERRNAGMCFELG
ncbi:hypothetical protein GWI33_000887, partial [Rhynchophorus ferrugineus]